MDGTGKKVVIHPSAKADDHHPKIETPTHLHFMHSKKVNTRSRPPPVSGPPPIIVATKASNLFKNAHPASIASSDPSKGSSKQTKHSQEKATPAPNQGHFEQSRKMKRELKMLEETKLRKTNANSRIHYLAKKTHFDMEQIKSLIDMFRALTATNPMDRQKFRQILHNTFGMNSNAMLDRIFSVFDGDNEGTISETEWVLGLSVMLRGTLDEKIHFSYEIYDLNGDNSIGRDEIQNYCRGCFRPVAAVHNEDEDDFGEFEKEIVELALRKFDVDRDGVVQIGDFHQAVYEDPLLLQALGPCLPSSKITKAFLAMLDTNYDNFISGLSVPGDVGWDHCRHEPSKNTFGTHRRQNAHHAHQNAIRPKNVVSVFSHKRKRANEQEENG